MRTSGWRLLGVGIITNPYRLGGVVSGSMLPIWGPNPAKLPPDAPDSLRDAYRAIERAGKEIDRACYALAFLQNQKDEFVELIIKENLDEAFSTINYSITRDLIVTRVALYDKDGTHIRKSAEELLHIKYKETLENYAIASGVSLQFHLSSRKRLESVVRLAQSAGIRESYVTLKHYRNKLIAHFDNNPRKKLGHYRAIERLLTVSTRIVIDAVALLEGVSLSHGVRRRRAERSAAAMSEFMSRK